MENNYQQPPETACPLCSQANNCALAADDSAKSCWCQHTTIDKQALSQLLSNNKSCICQPCANNLDASSLARLAKEIS